MRVVTRGLLGDLGSPVLQLTDFMSNWIHYLTVPMAGVAAVSAHATVYHSVESAQRACFPEGPSFVAADITLTKVQMRSIEKATGVRVRLNTQRVWRVEQQGALAGWFLVDEVLGKHDYITYALALTPDGAVRSIEVMDYRENYGYEVRNADWRIQFLGKTKADPVQLNADIKNITGATLSCRHVSEGVKRLLFLHDLVLKR